jgi:hypothetical protein
VGPKRELPQSGQLFGFPLLEHLNQCHPLIRVAALIDWDAIERVSGEAFQSKRGRPAARPRLIAGLLYLQHAYDLSDEEVVWAWVENPYWQMFTGETYLQKDAPIDQSSLTRWRKRLGEASVEELLAQTIEAAKRATMVKPASIMRVIVDTTVMEKAIAHPTDSRLLERAREQMVKAAQERGLTLRQNYNREAPRPALQAALCACAAVQADEGGIADAAHPGWPCLSGYPAPDRQGAAASASRAQRVAEQDTTHPDTEDQGQGQEQAVCIARPGSRVRCQGKSQDAV